MTPFRFTTLVLSALFCLMVAPSAHAERLLAIGGDQLAGCSSRDVSIYEIAPLTLERSAVVTNDLFDTTGDPASDRVSGLAIHPTTGLAYIVTDDILGCGSGDFSLWSYEFGPGAVAELIGTFANWVIDDITFAPDGTLYGFAENDGTGAAVDDVVTIDLVTGEPTILGDSTFGGADGKLAFAPDGTLWVGLGSIVGTVDTVTGLASLVGIQNGFTNEALAFDAEGLGFMVSGHSAIRTFDPSVSATLLSSPVETGETDISALAFVPTSFATTGADEAKCVNKMLKGAELAGKFTAKAASACLKARQKGEVLSFGDCLDANVEPLNEKNLAKLEKFEAKSCASRPDYGLAFTGDIAYAALVARGFLAIQLFGHGEDETIFTEEENKAAAKCQAKLFKTVEKQNKLLLKAYGKCVKLSLAEGRICSVADYASCFAATASAVTLEGSALSKARGKIEKISTKCTEQGVDFANAFVDVCPAGNLDCLLDRATCSACVHALSFLDAVEGPGACDGFTIDPTSCFSMD